MHQTFHTIEDMTLAGSTIAKSLTGGSIVTLTGELGAGKTTFAKGILAYFGIPPETVTSPTFSIMNIYPAVEHTDTIKHIVHIDTYRLNDAEELLEIGFEDYLHDPETLILIEWPEKVEHIIDSLARNIHKYNLAHTADGGRLLTSSSN